MSGETKNLSPEASESENLRWSGLLETSRRFGAYSWVELRMFQILGSWAGSEADPRLSVMFDDHSRRHSWHSTVWFDRLPLLSNVDTEELVRAPSEAFAALLDELAELRDPLERLSGGYEVMVTHLIVSYRQELDRLDPVGDATARHWLGFLLQNLTEELLQGASEIHDGVNDSEDLDQITSARKKFSEKLLRCGGILALT